MDDIECEHEYKPRWWAIVLSMGHSALGAVVCGLTASSNVPASLRVLYWVLCGLGIGLAALVGVRAVERLLLRRRVALTPSCLLLPKTLWSAQEVAIDYEAITGLFISSGVYAPRACRVAIDCQAAELPTHKVKRARFLYVTHTGGERRIVAAELPSQAAFEEVCALLTARVRASRQAGCAELS
jgi:hypothetical protein